MKELAQVFSSKKVRWIAGGIGACILALLIFHAGIAVGSHRHPFGWPSGRFGTERGFRSPFLPGGFELPHEFIQNGHGAVGTIQTITLPTFLMQTREGASQTVLVSTSTIIRSARGTATNALAAGSRVIVLGDPDSQNQIDAKFITILPTATSTP